MASPMVSGACDACRRRKSKCSGTQPCERCERNGIACTYGHAAGRTTTAEYTRHLEGRVAELQALLERRAEAAQVSASESSSTSEHQQQQRQQQPQQQSEGAVESDAAARDRLIDTFIRPEDDYIFVTSQRASMAYHGRYGGLSALRMVRDLIRTEADPVLVPADAGGAGMAEAFDTSLLDLPHSNDLAVFALLPSREKLHKTISIALDVGLSCKECLDREQLWREIDELYMRDPDDHSDEERSLLALVYALMALGRRYESEDPAIQQPGPSRVVLRGLSYFRASKAIVDSAGYADLNTVRTTICLAMFLMSSSMASKAYSIVCAGVSVALRLGLHVPSSTFQHRLSAYELTQRRRTFAVLNMLTIIISSMLGMPNILRNADPGQCLPVPDEDVTDKGCAFILADPFSPVAETIISARIYRVLSEIIEGRFPASSASHVQPGVQPDAVYEVDRTQIADLAAELDDLQRRFLQIPPNTSDQRALLAQLYIRMQHSGVQLILYRPFITHLSRNRQDPSFNYDGYAFGSTALKAAAQLVWVIDAFDNYGMLHEAQWFAIFFLSIAATSLIYYVLGNQDDPSIEESKAAVIRANEMLKSLAVNNISARTCHESIAPLMVQLRRTGSAPGTPSPRTQFMRGLGIDVSRRKDQTAANSNGPCTKTMLLIAAHYQEWPAIDIKVVDIPPSDRCSLRDIKVRK